MLEQFIYHLVSNHSADYGLLDLFIDIINLLNLRVMKCSLCIVKLEMLIYDPE